MCTLSVRLNCCYQSLWKGWCSTCCQEARDFLTLISVSNCWQGCVTLGAMDHHDISWCSPEHIRCSPEQFLERLRELVHFLSETVSRVQHCGSLCWSPGMKMKKEFQNSFPLSSTALSTYLLLSPASETKGRCTEGSGHKQLQTARETGDGDLGQQNKKGTGLEMEAGE